MTPTLPPDFKRISLEHPRSRVLASVPGTPQAAEAVLLAQVPQTARVNRKTLQAPEVIYQGDPEFEPIEGTLVARAVNTDKDIIKVGDLYYMCFQGVWFMGRARTAHGRSLARCREQIYEIPVELARAQRHLRHRRRQRRRLGDVRGGRRLQRDDGRLGLRGVGHRVVLPALCLVRRLLPGLLPVLSELRLRRLVQPVDRRLRPRRRVVRTVRRRRRRRPLQPEDRHLRARRRRRTVRTARAAPPQPTTRGPAPTRATRQGSSVYGSWGSTAVQRGDQWAQTTRASPTRATGTTTRATQGSGGGAAVTRNGPGGNNSGVARTGSGDIYAGRDGNVYRRQDGGWQKYDNGSWGSANTPTQQLDRDRAARAEGATRTRDYGAARSSGGTRSTGSYRPSAGTRGGGGRRR